MRTFADMKDSMNLLLKRGDTLVGTEVQSVDDISIGCGLQNDNEVASTIQTIERRRRVQHVQNADACNNVTNFFCWMQCLDIPSAGKTAAYASEGYSLYCLDPAILAQSGNQVSKAVAPCKNGYVHNSNCLGSWQPTAPGVIAIDVKVNQTGPLDKSYCYGGTSMYMDGFHWLDSACIIFLFPSWVLSSPGRIAVACFGTILLGILLEKVIHERRYFLLRFDSGYGRLAVSALCYGIQLTMGYFVMLIVMTYSGPLFLSSIIGLMFGHVLFNAKDAIFPTQIWNRSKVIGSPMDSLGNATLDQEETPICCHKNISGEPAKEEQQSDHVPEGITPCCMNAL